MLVGTAFPATVQAVVLETILAALAVLFLPGAGGDMAAARQAASRMLAAYNPQNDDELRLAAIVASFSFRAIEALGQAAAPDLSISRVLRLSGSAVSLSREAAKAERRLTQLQNARLTAIPARTAIPERVEAQPNAEPPAPVAQPASVVQAVGKVAALAKANGTTWACAYEERQRELRIAARAEAKFGPQVAAAIRADIAGNPAMARGL